MRANGHRSVWVHAIWCSNVGGHKNKASRDINVCAGYNFIALWPEKFPRSSCFAKIQKNMHGELQTGENGRAWVRTDACTGGESKNKNKKRRK